MRSGIVKDLEGRKKVGDSEMITEREKDILLLTLPWFNTASEMKVNKKEALCNFWTISIKIDHCAVCPTSS